MCVILFILQIQFCEEKSRKYGHVYTWLNPSDCPPSWIGENNGASNQPQQRTVLTKNGCWS